MPTSAWACPGRVLCPRGNVMSRDIRVAISGAVPMPTRTWACHPGISRRRWETGLVRRSWGGAMASRLIDSLATTDEMAELFSDGSVLRAMLRFEVGLALAQARLGMIPAKAAEAIARAAVAEDFDPVAIARD